MPSVTESRLYSAAFLYMTQCPVSDNNPTFADCEAELRDALRAAHALADERATPITIQWLQSLRFTQNSAGNYALHVTPTTTVVYSAKRCTTAIAQGGSRVTLTLTTRGQILDLLSVLNASPKDIPCETQTR